MSEFSKKELKEKFTNIKKAFECFDKIELKGRKYIQEAILDCYDIYLHYNEKLIKKRCKKSGISYKLTKPMKMILMLAMGVSDDCDDERVKARVRTYVRVLKRFDSLSYDLDDAAENLSQYGIDYFANFRSKHDDADDMSNNDTQLELPFGDDDENTEENDEEEGEGDDDDIDDVDHTDINILTTEPQPQSLGDKTIKFFQSNNIKDKNYVIWVTDNEVYKSIDTTLLRRLDDFDFIKLK